MRALRLLPPPLHRTALRLAHRLRVRWWRWRKPMVQGVSVIARDDRGRILLIRQSYGGEGWHLPSGGLHSGEDPRAAARREVAEELGCPLADLAFLAVHEEDLFGAPSRVHLFTAHLAGTPRIDGREVVEAQLFARGALPANLGRRAATMLALLPG